MEYLSVKLTRKVADEGLIGRLAEHLFNTVVFDEVRKELQENRLPGSHLILGDTDQEDQLDPLFFQRTGLSRMRIEIRDSGGSP